MRGGPRHPGLRTPRLVELGVALLVAVTPVRGQSVSGSGLVPGLATVVDSLGAAVVAQPHVAGISIAVARGGVALVDRSYGAADVDTGEPLTPGHLMEVGSITKQFTAAAVLRLAGQGKLDLDAPIRPYIPESRWGQVTTRQLLTHLAGVPDFTRSANFDVRMGGAPSLAEVLRLIEASEPSHAPGDAMVYSNSHYLLLARILERIEGVDYAALIRDDLLAPTGVRTARDCADLAEGRAAGHQYRDGALRSVGRIDHGWSSGAASFCSTAGDLVRWAEALHSGRVASGAAYQEMLRPGRLNAGFSTRFGAGVMLDSLGGHPALRHGGSLPGFRSELVYYPDDSLAIAVLLNSNGPQSPAAVAREIATVVLGVRDSTVDTGPADPGDYVGRYAGLGREGNRTMTISLRDGHLHYRSAGSGAGRLTHLGGERFAAGEIRITFLREGDAITGMVMDDVATVAVHRRLAEP